MSYSKHLSKHILQLQPHQIEGVEWLITHKGNGLICDEQRVGKTPTAIEYLNRVTDYPVLIVCLCSGKYNWLEELGNWLTIPKSISVIDKKWKMADIVIVNYDILKTYEEEIKEAKFQIIIADEVQKIKNYKSQRSKSMMRICKTIPFKIFLTGTLTSGRNRELYPVLKIFANHLPTYDKYLVQDYWTFAKRFCGLHKKKLFVKGGREIMVLDDSANTNTEQLHQILNQIMLRRLRKDVLDEQPKIQNIIPIEDRDDEMESMFSAQFKRDEEAGLPPNTEAYRIYAGMKKVPQAIEFIKELAEDEKVVVGIHHKEVGNALWKGLKEFNPLAIGGSTSPKDRKEIERQFQFGDSKIIICSMQCVTGMTFNAACKIVVCEALYTPDEISQFTDRCGGIGQTKQVEVTYLTIRQSTDSAMMRNLIKKHENASIIMDGQKQNLFA